ncbi:shikimate kinase [Heyndrickxia sp. MSNUG]|uniref:shikimate kinase n=1 Tax=Heyndrickxia sp. MSNUG TaxID=3136677 RepID=UPI003C2C4272
MCKYHPRKIHIIGSVGSGKTTLGRILSKKLNVPHCELDNVVWKRFDTGDVRRNEAERDEYLFHIIQSDGWIIEGVHYEWVQQSFKNADMIILLNPAYSTRTYRIIKRFILQKLGIEKSNYKPTFAMFRKMFVWNRHFENKSKPEILKILNEYEDKVVTINDTRNLEKIIDWSPDDERTMYSHCRGKRHSPIIRVNAWLHRRFLSKTKAK